MDALKIKIVLTLFLEIINFFCRNLMFIIGTHKYKLLNWLYFDLQSLIIFRLKLS